MKLVHFCLFLLSWIVVSASALDRPKASIRRLAANEKHEIRLWGSVEEAEKQCETELVTCMSGAMTELPVDRFRATLAKLVVEGTMFGDVLNVVEEMSQVDFSPLFDIPNTDTSQAASQLEEIQQLAREIDDANVLDEASPDSNTANQLGIDQLSMIFTVFFDFIRETLGLDVAFLRETLSDLNMVSGQGLGAIISVLVSGIKSVIILIIERTAQGIYLSIVGGGDQESRRARLCMTELTQCEFNTMTAELIPMMVGEAFANVGRPATPADETRGTTP